jgi:protein involved in temperature-dependent protein secretion
LSYNYGDRADKLLEENKITDARQAAESAVRYSPNNSDSHLDLGFLDYLAGDKSAALREFLTAKKLDPNFRKEWDAEVAYEKAFAPMLQDKEFLKQLFPDGK